MTENGNKTHITGPFLLCAFYCCLSSEQQPKKKWISIFKPATMIQIYHSKLFSLKKKYPPNYIRKWQLFNIYFQFLSQSINLLGYNITSFWSSFTDIPYSSIEIKLNLLKGIISLSEPKVNTEFAFFRLFSSFESTANDHTKRNIYLSA